MLVFRRELVGVQAMLWLASLCVWAFSDNVEWNGASRAWTARAFALALSWQLAPRMPAVRTTHRMKSTGTCQHDHFFQRSGNRSTVGLRLLRSVDFKHTPHYDSKREGDTTVLQRCFKFTDLSDKARIGCSHIRVVYGDQVRAPRIIVTRTVQAKSDDDAIVG